VAGGVQVSGAGRGVRGMVSGVIETVGASGLKSTLLSLPYDKKYRNSEIWMPVPTDGYYTSGAPSGLCIGVTILSGMAGAVSPLRTVESVIDLLGRSNRC